VYEASENTTPKFCRDATCHGAKNFLNIITGSPKEFAAYIDTEAAKWSAVIKAAHLQIN
jgi:hypothetical protein